MGIVAVAVEIGSVFGEDDRRVDDVVDDELAPLGEHVSHFRHFRRLISGLEILGSHHLNGQITRLFVY